MYPHLPDGDRSGYGADFYHADRSYHQQFVYVGSGDHLQLWFHFPENGYRGKQYISQTVNLKFIPDMVTFSQYATVLFKSPDYLLKFWNSVILVVPIVVFRWWWQCSPHMASQGPEENFPQSSFCICDLNDDAISGYTGAKLSGLKLDEATGYELEYMASGYFFTV